MLQLLVWVNFGYLRELISVLEQWSELSYLNVERRLFC